MNQSEHSQPVQNSIIGTVTGQQNNLIVPSSTRSRLGKDHADYWLGKIRHRTYFNTEAKQVEAPEWSVRLRLGHHDVWFNLTTSNKQAAAGKARDIYVFAKANGIDAAIAKFKHAGIRKPAGDVTVGDWLLAIDALGELRPKTQRTYAACLRTIAAGIIHLRDDGSRFDYRSEKNGAAKWRERVDAVKLDRLSPDAITRWQREFVSKAGKSPAARGSAKRTVNSYIRQARSLFVPVLAKKIDLELPVPRPFEGIEMMENGSTRYVSKINVPLLVATARNELRTGDPEAYKAWLLTFFGGLRKQEADFLEWTQVDWHKGGVRIEATRWFSPKTQSSCDFVALDPEVMLELREFLQSGAGDFVLIGQPPKHETDKQFYRAEKTWQRLYAWLRLKGITANKPVHEMRKEAGATLATTRGIYAASRFLRHSDLTTTARHYADQKERVTTGLGPLLSEASEPAVVHESKA